MSKFWSFLTQVHSLSGPVLMLLYPLYASVIAIETTSKVDDEQWLAYWILYSFLTLMEMLLQPLLEWIPIWYDIKLAFVAWLVLPQFRGSAFIYNTLVREQMKRYGLLDRLQQSHDGDVSPLNGEEKAKAKSKVKKNLLNSFSLRKVR